MIACSSNNTNSAHEESQKPHAPNDFFAGYEQVFYIDGETSPKVAYRNPSDGGMVGAWEFNNQKITFRTLGDSVMAYSINDKLFSPYKDSVLFEQYKSKITSLKDSIFSAESRNIRRSLEDALKY